MKDEVQNFKIRAGEPIELNLSDGEVIRTKVRKAEDRYLWIPDLIDADALQNRGNFLEINLVGKSGDISIKALIAGKETAEGSVMTKLVVITAPIDNNRREAFRLHKLFDLSVCRKFEKAVEGVPISCQGLDISDTGLGFATTQWFQYGELVECKFSLGDARYHLTAKIVRVIKQSTSASEKIYKVGAMFIRTGDNIRKRIRRYIYLQQTAQRRIMGKEPHE